MRFLSVFLLIISLTSPVLGVSSPWKANWVWNKTPRKDNYFRKVINAADKPSQAKIAITADNIYELFVNDTRIGSNDDWMNLEVYDVTKHIKKGRNIIAVKAIDPGTDVGALLLEGAITYANGKITVFGTDKTWKLSGTEQSGWRTLGFDDSSWQTPREIGKPPAGPWGGIDHPALAPKTPLKVVSVTCPRKIKQGQVLAIKTKVTPKVDIPFDSPVALQALVAGEPAYEHWIEPGSSTSTWKAGKSQTVTFKDFRLPLYIPSGKVTLRVITNATESIGGTEVVVGNPVADPVAPKLARCDFSVQQDASDSRKLKLDVKAPEAPKGTAFLFALYKGKEMWMAADVKAGASVVTLPHGFPGGKYRAEVLPYRMQCIQPTVHQVTITGSDDTRLKPLGYGTFTDRSKLPHRWYVNAHGALFWDGKPYVPAGAMYLSRFLHDFKLNAPVENEKKFKEDIRLLSTLKNAGVTDVYLNPCARWQDKPVWVWQRWADICEQVGMNYGIQVTNQVRTLKSFSVAQDEYLVTIKGGETAKAVIPGDPGAKPTMESTVYYAAFDPQTNEILDSGKAKIKPAEMGVEAEATPKAPEGKEISVHFIPEYEYGDGMHDYWQGLDQYSTWAKDFFGRLRLGPNFRLWIDPLDNEQGFGGRKLLPKSKEFREMFARYLEKKYRTPEEVAKVWMLTGADKLDFAAFSRFIPLGKPAKDSDTGYAVDSGTGKTYRVDLKKSAMWYDMLWFRDSSIAHFNSEASEIIKSYYNAPVVLKGTATNAFTNLRTHGGFDGVGMEAYGSAPELVRGCGGGVYSRCKQSNRTMWTLTTETGFTEEFCGYPDPIRLIKELGSMLEMNGKGTFYFVLGAPSESGWSIFNLFDDPRQLYWLGTYAKLIKSSKKLPYYEPDVDWYFPGNVEGQENGFNAADPGFFSDNPSQSIAGNSGKWVVTTSTQVPIDAKRIIANLENSPATDIYGETFEDLVKTREVTVVGHRRNLGALSIDRYYTDRFVKDTDGTEIQALSPTPTSKVIAKTADGVVYGLIDGNLTIYSKSNWIGSVRKMAGKPSETDFFKDVLGLNVMDLGPAFQGIQFANSTYIWNILEPDNTLTVNAPSKESEKLFIPAKASKPVSAGNPASVKVAGIDEANLKAAKFKWEKAAQAAKGLGIDPGEAPKSTDWRHVFSVADKLLKDANETYQTTTAPRVAGIKVDGDLSEWAGSKPLMMAYDVNIDYAYPKAYDGAKFYIGYDDDYIYLAGDVDDTAIVNNYKLDSLWNGDAIEAFFDLYPDADPGKKEYNEDCFQFLFAPTDKEGKPAVVKKNPHLPPDTVPESTLWTVKKRDGGWSFEAAIHMSDLNGYKPAQDGKIGFTIQLDDSDGGDRTSVKLWRGRKDTSRNRLAFGRLVFGK